MGPISDNFYFDPTQFKKVDFDKQAAIRPDPDSLQATEAFNLKKKTVEAKTNTDEARIKEREKEQDQDPKNKKKKDPRFEPGLGKGLMTGPDRVRISEALNKEKGPKPKNELFDQKKDGTR